MSDQPSKLNEFFLIAATPQKRMVTAALFKKEIKNITVQVKESNLGVKSPPNSNSTVEIVSPGVISYRVENAVKQFDVANSLESDLVSSPDDFDFHIVQRPQSADKKGFVVFVGFCKHMLSIFHSGKQIFSLRNQKSQTKKYRVRPSYMTYSNYGRGAKLFANFLFFIESDGDQSLRKLNLDQFLKADFNWEDIEDITFKQTKDVMDLDIDHKGIYYCTENMVCRLKGSQLLVHPEASDAITEVISWTDEQKPSSIFTAVAAIPSGVLAVSIGVEGDEYYSHDLRSEKKRLSIYLLNRRTMKKLNMVEIAELSSDPHGFTPVHAIRTICTKHAELAVLLGVYYHVHLVAAKGHRLELLQRCLEMTEVYNNSLAIDRDLVYVCGFNFICQLKLNLP